MSPIKNHASQFNPQCQELLYFMSIIPPVLMISRLRAPRHYEEGGGGGPPLRRGGFWGVNFQKSHSQRSPKAAVTAIWHHHPLAPFQRRARRAAPSRSALQLYLSREVTEVVHGKESESMVVAEMKYSRSDNCGSDCRSSMLFGSGGGGGGSEGAAAAAAPVTLTHTQGMWMSSPLPTSLPSTSSLFAQTCENDPRDLGQSPWSIPTSSPV